MRPRRGAGAREVAGRMRREASARFTHIRLRAASAWWEWTKIAAPILVVAGAAFWGTWQFAEPAPPARVVIATGSAGGTYASVARRYAEQFRRAGVRLEVKETAGSVENYRLLLDGSSGVRAAIVQGGTAPPEAEESGLRAVASIYLEPLWLFHRLGWEVTELRQLAGHRVAVGAEGSGTRMLALELARANRLQETKDTTLVPLGGQEGLDALRAGNVDAAFFVIAPSAPLIAEALGDPALRLVDFERAEAYTRRFRTLRGVLLPQGAVDLAANLPRRDVHLLATHAAIVVRDDTHPSVVQLLVRAAESVHRPGDLLSEPDAFPSDRGTELPVSEEARFFLHNRPNFLQRNLPFWAASLINRLVILVIPLLVVLIPLVRIAPPVYRWRIRSRIYRWYSRLRRIDEHFHDGTRLGRTAEDLARLDALEHEIALIRVPPSHMDELYDLRLHLGYMRERLEARLAEAETGSPGTEAETGSTGTEAETGGTGTEAETGSTGAKAQAGSPEPAPPAPEAADPS